LEHAKTIRPTSATAEKCSRTFITFSDEVVYRRYFPSRRKLRSSDKSTCPVTGLPAKYFDPITRIPYASMEAFKVIRQSFHKDTDLDQSDVVQPRQTVVSWLQITRAVSSVLYSFCNTPHWLCERRVDVKYNCLL